MGRRAVLGAALGMAGGFGLWPRARAEASAEHPQASAVWLKVRASLFGERRISEVGDELLVLEVPYRATDAAVVPVAMRSRLPQTAARHVRKLYLVIDQNPSPVSAIFELTPQSGRAEIETRVRVDEYSHVRLIAETSDGELLMRTRFVKASGGCSAAPGKDVQAALASLGKLALRVDPPVTLHQPTLAQLLISHPNDSGMVMDQLSRQYTPRRFVRTVDLRYSGQPVLSADLDFSISENPSLRFYFVPDAPGSLTVEVSDTDRASWTGSLDVTPSA